MYQQTSKKLINPAIFFLFSILLISSFLIKDNLKNEDNQINQAQASGESWYSNDGTWDYRKSITIKSDLVSVTTASFPALVSVTDTDLRNHANANGYDLIFTDDDGITLLDFEIESWNSSTGELQAWVETDISATTDKVIYIYYGNSSATDESNATGVWDSNYKLVQHLQEIPAGITYDSTSNNNDGTTSGMDSSDQVDGKIDGGLDFDGGDDGVDIPDSSSLDIFGNITISLWVYHNNTANATILQKGAAYLFSRVSNERMKFVGYGLSDSTIISSGGWLPLNTWTHLVARYNGSEICVYQNGGAFSMCENSSGNINTNNDSLKIGGTAEYFNGQIDEVRISNTARSENWIKTEYANQNSPSTFITLSAQETETTQTCVDAGGTCQTNQCSSYTSCSSISGTCNIGYCCSGSCDIIIEDTEDPSIPTNLTATAISSSQINLSWNASTDNIGVTGYNIYRDTTLIDTSSNTTYSNTGLSVETTYAYTVSAYDIAGNTSNQSSSDSATTQSVPQGDLPIIPNENVNLYGMDTTAGSGRHLGTPETTIYKVTNLNDSGAGSLRDALAQTGPATVVFEVSGTIELESPLGITSYLTIAGQTAPSPGITIKNYGININRNMHDILVQHIRFRAGDKSVGDTLLDEWTDVDGNGSETVYSHLLSKHPDNAPGYYPPSVWWNWTHLDEDPGQTTNVGANKWDWDNGILYVNVGTDPANGKLQYGVSKSGISDPLTVDDHYRVPDWVVPYRIVIDHCSFSWGGDMNAMSGGQYTTLSNCIISEGLSHPWHPKGYHSKGYLVKTDNGENGAKYVAIINNIFAHNVDRNPTTAGVDAIIVNNLLFDIWFGICTDDHSNRTGDEQISIVGNYIIETDITKYCMYIRSGVKETSKIYISDTNYYNGKVQTDPWNSESTSCFQQRKSFSLPQSDVPEINRAATAEEALWPAGYVAMSAIDTRTYVLANAGARPTDRDSVDTRIISEVIAENQTSAIIQTVYADNHDCYAEDVPFNCCTGYNTGNCPDATWPVLAENTRPLTVPANPNQIQSSGYTNLEEWLHTYLTEVEVAREDPIDTAPPSGSVSINNNDATTNSQDVNLSLPATDPSTVTEMKISNTNNFNTAILYTYNAIKSWALTAGDGIKTVYAWFKDSLGNWNTTPKTDTIILDETSPTISNIEILNITVNSVQVNFKTDELTTSYIEYGLTTSYGNQTETNTTGSRNYEVGITNLSDNTTYNFCITSTDSATNISQSINYTFTTSEALTPDTTAPASITDLSSSNITETSVDLSWTASGDDENIGVASTYDLRYSTSNITAGNFDNAIQLSGEPNPQTAGDTEIYTVTGLSANTNYFVAIKTNDEVPNTSEISNILCITTLDDDGNDDNGNNDGGGGGGGTVSDTTPPAQPTDFIATPADSQIVLTWTNPTDSDFVRVKLLRRKNIAPVSHNDSKAEIIYEGINEEYTDIELNNNNIYHYSIFAYDKKPNYSEILTISSQPIKGKTNITPPKKKDSVLPYPNGSLLKVKDDEKIYLIVNNERRWITNIEIFNSYGLTPNSEIIVSFTILNQYTLGENIDIPSPTAGTLIRGNNRYQVYIIKPPYKRHIFNPAVFNMYSHFNWDSVKDLDPNIIDSYITSDIYRALNDPRVYSLEEIDETKGKAIKHHLQMTAKRFKEKGYRWNQVFIVNDEERDYYETGTVEG